MSRRYGRNQKRRHREEIARLGAEVSRMSSAYQLTDGLSAELGRKLRQAQEQLREMVEIIERVCPHSVALPPKGVVGGAARNHYRLQARPPGLTVAAGGNVMLPSWSEAMVVDLFRLRMVLEERREQFAAAVHLVYADPGARPAGYMISRTALAALPEEVLLRQLLPDVGRQLLQLMRGERR